MRPWRQFQRLAEQPDVANFPTRKWTLLLAIAFFVAACASGYLSWVALTSSKVAGCGGGKLFNCGHVISSRWSLWFGIPVSVLALATHAMAISALLVAVSRRFSAAVRQVAWFVVSTLAFSAGAAAVWFVSLQIFALGHLCTYCLLAHFCGVVAAAIVACIRPAGTTTCKTAAIFGGCGAAILIVGQLLTPEPPTYRIETYDTPAGESEVFEFEAPVFEAPSDDDSALLLLELPSIGATAQLTSLLFSRGSLVSLQTENDDDKANRRMVPVNGGTVALDVRQWPIAGSPTAKFIFVEMFDYSCPHCRSTHAAIKDASSRLGGDMSVLVLPIPLAAACNDAIQVTDPKFTESCEIAALAVAVWRLSPAKFTEFHNWMFETATVPTYAIARQKAESLVDAKKLNAQLESGVPAEYVAKMVELFKRAGGGNVPKLIFPTTTIVGAFTSGESLEQIVRQQIR